jgi:hypothetical protein
MGAVKQPALFRKGLVHKVQSFLDTPLAVHGFDDEVCARYISSLDAHGNRSNSTRSAVANGTVSATFITKVNAVATMVSGLLSTISFRTLVRRIEIKNFPQSIVSCIDFIDHDIVCADIDLPRLACKRLSGNSRGLD